MTKYDDLDSNIMCNSNEEEFELRRGPWTLEEDNLLIHYIACHGEGRWNLLAKCAGLKRTGKSCRLRWLNYLKPDIKRGNFTPQEQLLILELHSRWGNRWSKIVQHLPGRTDNEIKNYWRTRVQKQARQLNVDANSKTFLEAIKCFWMPRLLEKMEQSSSYSNSSMSSSSSLSSSSSISTMENQDSAFGSLPANYGILIPSSAKPRKLMDTSNDKKEKYSNSSNCSNSFSSDSEIRVVKLPEMDEIQTNSAQTCRINGCCNSIHGDCYHVNITSYSAECFGQQTMSAMGSQDLFMSEYQMPEADWFNDEVAGTFWNTDELWQFRKAEET